MIMKKTRFIFAATFFFIAVMMFSGCAASKKVAVEKSEMLIDKAQNAVKAVKKSVRVADNVIIDSHLIGGLTRPFSYSFRALTWSRDMAYQTVTTLPAILVYPRNTDILPLFEGEPMDLVDFEEYLKKLTSRDSLKGSMTFLIDGEEFFSRLLEEIEGAKSSIDIRIFIFDNDDYAVKVANLLKEKSRQGVNVRVLLDATGQILGEGKVSDDLPEGFVPPHSMAAFLKKDSNIQVRIRPNVLFKADHTKTITIDQRLSFIGGMNIGREYRYDWHDMMVELDGPALSEIIYEFNLAWEHASVWGDFSLVLAKMKQKRLDIKGDGVSLRMLYTRVNNPELFRAQLEAIRRAQKNIWINNAYFSDNDILHELISARHRGVDVRVIFPVKGNHEIMNKSNIVTANILFRNKVRVYFYPGMSHIKAAVYDGWLCTGSANFDVLSLRDNLEMNVATSDVETVERIKRRLFEKDFARSHLMIEPLDSSFSDVIAEIIAERL